LLKRWELSPAQYNVLRILRGAEPDGLNCRGIGQRMIAHDPDITRLLDRLEKRGLAQRQRDRVDRRVITTRITETGLALLAQADRPVEEFNRQLMGSLGAERLRTLIQLLDELRVS
jgi:DNA-binding MarR family transcriptional regulator